MSTGGWGLTLPGGVVSQLHRADLDHGAWGGGFIAAWDGGLIAAWGVTLLCGGIPVLFVLLKAFVNIP